MGVFAQPCKLWYWATETPFGRKENNVTFYDIIHWRLSFFEAIQTGRRNCKWRKENFAEIWLFFLSAKLWNWPISLGASIRYYEDLRVDQTRSKLEPSHVFAEWHGSSVWNQSDYISKVIILLRLEKICWTRGEVQESRVRRKCVALHNEPPAGRLLQYITLCRSNRK